MVGTNDKIPKLDMDGDARPHMGVADMGCDEFTDTHPLEADKFKLSANGPGGAIEFTLHGKAGNAGREYFILGSVTGTAPGLLLPGGKAVLPINFDLFTEFVIAHIDSLIFVDFMGALDPATGDATATFNAEGLLKPEMEGWALSFAYALTFPWNFVSNPVVIDIGV